MGTLTSIAQALGTFADFDDILATYDNIRMAPITVASGQGVLKRGTLLQKNASGKYVVCTSLTNLAGVLVEDVDTASGDVASLMYVEGTFKKDKLVAGTGVTIASGIYNYGNIVII
jgi:hypothetical protein